MGGRLLLWSFQHLSSGLRPPSSKAPPLPQPVDSAQRRPEQTTPRVLLVSAVVPPPASGRAPPHVGLISIRPDGPWSHPEVSRPRGIEGFSTAQLPAHHVGIVQVPTVITDGAPGALVKDLHSPGAGTAPVHQAELSAVWGERNGTMGRWQGNNKGLLSCGTLTWAVGGALLWGRWFRHWVFALGQRLGLFSCSNSND